MCEWFVADCSSRHTKNRQLKHAAVIWHDEHNITHVLSIWTEENADEKVYISG